MGQQRRSFTSEFKQEAVDLCRRSGKSVCQVARQLDRLPFTAHVQRGPSQAARCTSAS